MNSGEKQFLSDQVSADQYEQRGCAGLNLNIFFPPGDEDIARLGDNVILLPNMSDNARRICQECQIRKSCWETARARGEDWGIFGGEDFSK